MHAATRQTLLLFLQIRGRHVLHGLVLIVYLAEQLGLVAAQVSGRLSSDRLYLSWWTGASLPYSERNTSRDRLIDRKATF
jgi:hypothetical protein